jgi:hypothetical protein
MDRVEMHRDEMNMTGDLWAPAKMMRGDGIQHIVRNG